MRPFWNILTNAFMELVRQPIFLLLLTTTVSFCVFLAAVPYFGFGDDPKMVKDSVMAAILLSGLFVAVMSASSSVAKEIRTGTALAVLSKPVGRARFLLAKYLGLVGVLILLTYSSLVSALLASRIAFDAYGDADVRALTIFFGSILAAYTFAGVGNYFLRKPFIPYAVFGTVIMVTVAFIWVNYLSQLQTRLAGDTAKQVDWRLIRAIILIGFAFLILAAVALACSTRLDTVPTLAVCSGIFLLGLFSDYMFGQLALEGKFWASILYAVLPNWQLFWMADALEGGKNIPWGYIAKSFTYVICYVSAVLALGLWLFEDRELN